MPREKHIYEILVRFGPDGFKGAHVIDLERIIDDGEVVAEKELPARPVTAEEVGQHLGEQSAALIAAVAAAEAKTGVAEAASSEMQAALEASQSGAAEHKARADALQSRLDQIRGHAANIAAVLQAE